MPLQKKDFIEIEFTAKTKDGEVFDSNIKKDLEKLNSKIIPKPFVFCLGEGMFLKGIEDFLIGKEIGKYKIELSPEKAFGNRNSKFIQMIPIKVFNQQRVRPFPGAMFNMDNRVAKVLSVSGGRVMVDFNNPLAGKHVIYDLKILKKVEDINEKTKALMEFFTKKDLKFEIKNKKIILNEDRQIIQFLNLFKDKFKDILGLDLEVEEVKEEKKKEKN